MFNLKKKKREPEDTFDYDNFPVDNALKSKMQRKREKVQFKPTDFI